MVCPQSAFTVPLLDPAKHWYRRSYLSPECRARTRLLASPLAPALPFGVEFVRGNLPPNDAPLGSERLRPAALLDDVLKEVATGLRLGKRIAFLKTSPALHCPIEYAG